MKILKIAAISLLFALNGCGSTAKSDSEVGSNCPDKLTKFISGSATSEFVKSCLGKPNSENYNPDGRFVYLYYLPDNLIIAYLFGKDDKLIKNDVYEDTSR